MKNTWTTFGLLLILLAVPAFPALAAGEFSKNCASTTLAIPDGRIVEGRLGNVSGEHIVWIKFPAKAGATYSIEAFHPTIAGTATPTVQVFNESDINPMTCGTVASTVTLRDTSNIDAVVQANGKRFSVTGTGADLFVRVSGFLNEVLSFQVAETTQFHPGWSTGGGFNTFYSIQNTTNASCSITLTLFNLAGTQVATTTQSVAAAALLATNTQALGVGAGLAGTGRLTHDCPPGGILVDAAIANFGTSPAAIIPAKFEAVRQTR